MSARNLLKDCQERGVSVEVGPTGKLRLRPAEKLSEDIKQKLRQHKDEILLIIAQQRPFLPRPAGPEENPNPWDAWEGFIVWLFANEKAHYLEVCEAEDAINELERRGITSGACYEAACRELIKRFETARKQALSRTVKVYATH